MNMELAEFVLGRGYYGLFEDVDMDKLRQGFYCLNSIHQSLDVGDISCISLFNEPYLHVELVWKIPSIGLRAMRTDYYDKLKNLQSIFKCAKKFSTEYFDFIKRFGIFVRIVSGLDKNEKNIIVARLVPIELASCEFDNYGGIALKCNAYSLYEWFGNYNTIFDKHQEILDKRNYILRTEMGILDARYEKFARGLSDIFPIASLYMFERPESIGFLNRGAITYMQKGLKHDLDKLSSVIQDIVSMRNCDYSRVVIDSLPCLDTLSGSRVIMSILDRLPKIKRLERNGAFTTAVWEDTSITRLKKSEEDEDDFEKLVFFLILKKLCDNNTHKMHNILTDYLNTFRDATVDIPKQKEEKAEKKRKEKEEVEEEERKKENDNGNIS